MRRPRAVLVGLLILLAAVLAWFVPMIWLTGGLERYVEQRVDHPAPTAHEPDGVAVARARGPADDRPRLVPLDVVQEGAYGGGVGHGRNPTVRGARGYGVSQPTVVSSCVARVSTT